MLTRSYFLQLTVGDMRIKQDISKLKIGNIKDKSSR